MLLGLVNGLALGLATTAVIVVSNLLTSLARRLLVREVRLLFYVLVIASTVTVVDRLMAAHFFRLHLALGIFVPLIASNCLIVARAELHASRNGAGAALLDALATGAGFTAALALVGALREALGALNREQTSVACVTRPSLASGSQVIGVVTRASIHSIARLPDSSSQWP